MKPYFRGSSSRSASAPTGRWNLNDEIRMAVLTVAASFAATFAYLWWHGEPQSPANPSLVRPMGARDASLPPMPPPRARPPPVDTPAPEQPAVKTASSPAPTNAVPATNLDGPALPVLVAVTAAARSAASPDENSASEPAEETMWNEVDILNTSEQPLAVTLVDFSPLTQKTRSTQVFVTPGGQAHISGNSELPIASGDAISLRSAGFRDMSQTVP